MSISQKVLCIFFCLFELQNQQLFVLVSQQFISDIEQLQREVTMHQWQLLMTFLSYNMTWWLVPSKAKRDSQELFFLVIELNLILYSPDIEVAKKDADFILQYCTRLLDVEMCSL